MKTTVIYHSADYDGIFCREIARKFLTDAEFIGWNFGDPPVENPNRIFRQSGHSIYVLDLPVDDPFGFKFAHKEERFDWLKDVIWIDHHKTSIQSHPTDIPGYRIDGVAACRLAWQWFTLADKSWKEGDGANPPNPNKGFYVFPEKQDFIDRKVSEPIAVRLAGEYDIWDKRDPDAETFQYALREGPLTPVGWAALFDDDRVFIADLMVKGRICQRYAQDVDASICKSRTWLMEWEGLKFLCVNSARFNSLFFAAKDMPKTGHDALLGFCFDGKCWTVSLYHAKHRTDLDLSEIAKKHSGGGHKGACGFTCKTLPFNL